MDEWEKKLMVEEKARQGLGWHVHDLEGRVDRLEGAIYGLAVFLAALAVAFVVHSFS